MSADGGRFSSIRGAYEQTPPPSPADAGSIPKVDTEGITDDVVVAVIEQLEKTGNRPHLLRELAVVLSSVNETVAKYVTLMKSPTRFLIHFHCANTHDTALLILALYCRHDFVPIRSASGLHCLLVRSQRS
jgi:hypothetical protein